MECFVCFEEFGKDDMFISPCNHSFCMDCYYKLKKFECPMCRGKLKKDCHHPAWGRNLLDLEQDHSEHGFATFSQLDEEVMFSIPLEIIDMDLTSGSNILGWRARRRKKRERNARKKQEKRERNKPKPKLTRRRMKRQFYQMKNRVGRFRRMRSQI